MTTHPYRKSISRLLAASVVAVALAPTARAAGDLFDGKMSGKALSVFAEGTVFSTSAWSHPNTSLAWSVTYDQSSTSKSPWTYSYTWSGTVENLILLQLDLWISAYAADLWRSPEPSGNISNLSFDRYWTQFTISFDSNLAPSWGDFYANDLVKIGQSTLVKKIGFEPSKTDPAVDFRAIALGDTATLKHDGARATYVPVPRYLDTVRAVYLPTAVVPERSTVLSAFGLIGGGVWTARRQRRHQA